MIIVPKREENGISFDDVYSHFLITSIFYVYAPLSARRIEYGRKALYMYD